MKYLKRFSIFESIKPSELIQSGEIFSRIEEYTTWEDLMYPVKVDYIQEVNQSDVDRIHEMIKDFLSTILEASYHKREIAEFRTAKRYYQDEFESAINFSFKSDQGWSTSEEIIFFKLVDEWWTIEVHLLGSYRYYICDGFDGLEAFFQHLKDWFTKPTKKQNESYSDQNFRKITDAEYDKLVWGGTQEGEDEESEWVVEKWEQFDKEEILKICKILYPDLDVTEYLGVFPYLPEMVEDVYYADPEAGGCQIKFYAESYKVRSSNHSIRITKLKDEWFYIFYIPCGSKYTKGDIVYQISWLFECDQWQGLSECLKWFISSQIKFG